jgi:hypothetical protein
MIVAAFDMGTRNFAFCVEYIPYLEIEKFLQMKTKPLFDVEGRAIDEYQQALEKIYTKGQLIECQRIDILDFCKSLNISNIYLGLTMILDKFICLWDKVDIFLIEQQMAYGRNKANIQALRLSQHCLSYFFTIYGSFREIIEWPSTHKTGRKMPCLKLDLPPRFRLYAHHPEVGRLAQLVEHCVHIAG